MIRFFITILFLVINSFVFGQLKPVAVHLYIADGVGFRADQANLYKRIYKSLHPDLDYKLIVINNNGFSLKRPREEEVIRQEIISALDRSLAENEIMSHLLISSHGATYTDGGEELTFLKHLGAFSNRKISSEFKEIFETLRYKAAVDLKIILNSCSTFAGSTQGIEERSMILLNYFNAYSGSIYGSHTVEVTQAHSFRDYFKFSYNRPNLLEIMGSGFVGVMMGSLIFEDPTTINNLVSAFIGILSVNQLAFVARRFVASNIKGSYIQLKNGIVHKHSVVRKIKAIKDIIQNRLNCDLNYL